MKKLIAILLAGIIVIGLCSACTIENDNTDKFVVSACIASEPETIDPALGYTGDALSYTYHTFEGLMKYSLTSSAVGDDNSLVKTEIVPGQASSLPTISSDQLVYTFALRDDIKWSDGVPVKASDFVYAWQRVVDPKTASDYGYILDGIVLNASAIQSGEKPVSELGIKALDEKTIEITLEAPCAYFLSLCGFASLMPVRKDIIEQYGDSWTNPENIVVNGPYKYSEWVHNSYIKMVTNENYYNLEKLGPDEIIWQLYEDEESAFKSYQSGEINFINMVPEPKLDSLKKTGDCFTTPIATTYYLYFNTRIITDWRVRAALTLSVNRDNIVKNVTNGGEIATGLVPKGIMDSSGNYYAENNSELDAIYKALSEMYPDFDLSTYEGKCNLAKKLVSDATTDGFNINEKIEYKSNTNETNRKIAEACVNDWKTVLGINVEFSSEDWKDYSSSLVGQNFGIARYGWVADINDPLTFLELFKSDSGYNFGAWESLTFDNLINEAKSATYGKKRDDILYQACEALFEEGGFACCPIYFYTENYCMNFVSNVGSSSTGCYFFMYADKINLLNKG